MKTVAFHLAITVSDLNANVAFYTRVLGCSRGRSSERWADLNFFGHQLVLHLCEDKSTGITQSVDDHSVPVPHFGLVLHWLEWESLVEKLEELNIDFCLKPYVRFKGQPGEQGTFFIKDPSGNALEFKAFRDPNRLFATV